MDSFILGLLSGLEICLVSLILVCIIISHQVRQ